MPELKKRLQILRQYWWNIPSKDPKKQVVNEAISQAYHAMLVREEIESGSDYGKELKVAVEVFWGDVPARYDDSQGIDTSEMGWLVRDEPVNPPKNGFSDKKGSLVATPFAERQLL